MEINMMTYTETLEKITTDERFASFQDFDPELLYTLEYFNEIPEDVIAYCFRWSHDQTEPYFEDVRKHVEVLSFTE